jgi:hypothetical protein
MSFSMTTEQIRARTKTVTRRVGWTFLKAGDSIQAVVKCCGLKKGEKLEQICVLRIISVRSEPVRAMVDDTDYGLEECRREGFASDPDLQWPDRFVAWFCATHKREPSDIVTRIEFEYV